MNDSMVQCLECGRQEQVNFAHCLRRGWPKCCGYTMRLMEHPDVSEVMADVLRPAREVMAAVVEQHERRKQQPRGGDPEDSEELARLRALAGDAEA